jgi:membrane protein required for colicin V production
MNPLDIGVVAVIVLSAIFAFARGFVREALSILAWVGAAFITFKGFNQVFALVDPMVRNPLLSQLIAGFGLFIVSLIILTIITSFVARSVRASAMSPIDRTLGFIFGLVRGAFILSLAYLLLDVAVPKDDRPAWIQQAKSAPFLQRGADELRAFLPENLKLRSASAADDAIKVLTPAIQAEQARRALTNPVALPQSKPDQPAPATPPAGYKPGERRDLDRLIGTQR